MELTYRGAHYDSTPLSLVVEESSLQGVYRGQVVAFRYPRHVPTPSTVHDLKYRGVAYRNDGSRPVMPLPVSRPALQNLTVDPTLWAARDELFTAAQQIHHDNLRRRLNHRIEVARSQGNEFLVRQLEAERSQTV